MKPVTLPIVIVGTSLSVGCVGTAPSRQARPETRRALWSRTSRPPVPPARGLHDRAGRRCEALQTVIAIGGSDPPAGQMTIRTIGTSVPTIISTQAVVLLRS
jgi:hypothetical protein